MVRSTTVPPNISPSVVPINVPTPRASPTWEAVKLYNSVKMEADVTAGKIELMVNKKA